VLVGAPVAAVECLRRLEEQRAGDAALLLVRDHLDHLHLARQRLRERVEETGAQVVAAAVRGAGAAIETIEIVELLLGELAAGDPGEAPDALARAGGVL